MTRRVGKGRMLFRDYGICFLTGSTCARNSGDDISRRTARSKRRVSYGGCRNKNASLGARRAAFSELMNKTCRRTRSVPQGSRGDFSFHVSARETLRPARESSDVFAKTRARTPFFTVIFPDVHRHVLIYAMGLHSRGS